MRRILAFLAVVAAVLAATTAPALADTLTVRKVDTTGFPKVVVTTISSGDTPSTGDFHLRENGRIIDRFDVVPIGETSAPVGIVLVIDTSASMARQGKLAAAKVAAQRFVANKLPNDVVAVVSFATEPRVVANFTGDAATLNQAIADLHPQGETALWEGVRTAAGLFDGHPGLQANLVVLSDGNDTVSHSSRAQAEAAAVGAHAVVFAIGLTGADLDIGALQALTDATGGATVTASGQNLDELYGMVQQRLQHQYEITYTSPSPTALTIDIDVVAGASHATASANTGAVSEGLSARPLKVAPDNSPLHGLPGVLLIMLLALVATAGAVWGVLMLTVGSKVSLHRTLATYGSRPETSHESDNSMTETKLLRRAVSITAKLAGRNDALATVEHALERADLNLRAAEALFFGMAGVVMVSAVGYILTQSLFGAVVVMGIAAMAPVAALKFLAARRQKKFVRQLPDTLQLLAGTLRAGYSLLQGLETVSQEIDDPMARELKRILAEARLGRSLDEAMEEAALRMESDDFSWVVMAVQVQREVGGNLAELLSTVTETMIARERLRREVKALTAEGRISAIVLGLLPVGLGLALWAMNPEYIGVLFDRTIGKMMLGGSCVMAVFGFWWMQKLIKIEA